MIGIQAFGGYVPRYRLDRQLIYQSMGWMAPGNKAHCRGEKAVAGFDEDSITMAVAASLDAMCNCDRSRIDSLCFASTCLPFKERLNAGIIKTALGLKNEISAADFSSGLRSGTTALLHALDSIKAKRSRSTLLCAADNRLGKPASPQEIIFGDAGAAFLVGDENVVAEFKGSYSTTHDFVDHYRGEFAKYDRQWEDRWIRDVGLTHLIPEAFNGFLQKYGKQISEYNKIVYPCHDRTARKTINNLMGIAPEMEQDNLQERIGDSGSAHALVMLVKALENAVAGERILVLSFGNGCDVLDFEVTFAIEHPSASKHISGWLNDRIELNNYTKYLVWRNILPVEEGLRSEEDLWTRWSLLWRKRNEILALRGTRCKQCGTVQYPPQRVCVNDECGAIDEMEEYGFSDKTGIIASYTGDNLASSFNPPAIYGQIEFEGGGKYMFDFADCELDALSTGMPVKMSFRKKYHDPRRDISGYFWKAVPSKETTTDG
ncbi:MAG: OB-fold domain-containing protein [Proteobacteria bacterium]|nr:OB-fold domain-containing protein [Pseudomonadota bacterium]MBU1451342.1 OB-fold domain-containing protein [Pseudomonadota bacterium]MBU2469537.1 OB-fold domain-containing protein [Pseudomonadota bacterium]MBU2518394.1 OB-fold domain-containing protein [Pseudomonadota bacterium]